MPKEAKKTNKMLISFDSSESQVKANRALDGLALARRTTKGAIAQHAIEQEVLPHTSQVSIWFEEYCSGKKSILGVMAAFFRVAGDDIGRGRKRLNCISALSSVYDYLHHFCNKVKIEIPTSQGNLWPSEAISLYVLDWKKLEWKQSAYYEVADMLALLDAAPEMAEFYGLPEESFVFEFFLIIDAIVEEWQNIRTEEKLYRQVSINHGRDVLLLPRSLNYDVLNLMDAPKSTYATVVSINREGLLNAPNYVYLSELPARNIPSKTWDDVDAAITALCPISIPAGEQHDFSPLRYEVPNSDETALVDSSSPLAGIVIVRGEQ